MRQADDTANQIERSVIDLAGWRCSARRRSERLAVVTDVDGARFSCASSQWCGSTLVISPATTCVRLVSTDVPARQAKFERVA
jgi:hypothetical protein